ncbi:hypothetical protein MY5147_009651 [Beauveria neobassiana]
MRSCQLPAGGRHRLLRPVAADEAAVLHEHWRLSWPFALATWGTLFLHLAKYHPAGLRKRTIVTIHHHHHLPAFVSASSRRHLSLIKAAPSEYSLGMARQQPRRLERPTGSLAGHARSTSSCGYANRGIPPGTSTVMRPQQARQLIFMTNILNFYHFVRHLFPRHRFRLPPGRSIHHAPAYSDLLRLAPNTGPQLARPP